jgi:hypothetical protein
MNSQERLKDAFHKVAMRKSAATQQAVLESVKASAFEAELASIDPSLEKMAGFWGSVGGFLKDWGPDILMTGLMFVPGVNVLAGAARLGLGAVRGARAIAGAARGARALGAAQKGLTAVKATANTQKAYSGYKALRASGQGAQAALKATRATQGAQAGANVLQAGKKVQQAGSAVQKAQAQIGQAKKLQQSGQALRTVGKQQIKNVGAGGAMMIGMGAPSAYNMYNRAMGNTPGSFKGSGGTAQTSGRSSMANLMGK